MPSVSGETATAAWAYDAHAEGPLLRHGWLLIAAHLMGWLPFALVKRVAFLYHYIPSLLISFLMSALTLDALTARLVTITRCPRDTPRGDALASRLALLRGASCALILLTVAGSSCYFAPLYFGWPLPSEEMQTRAGRLEL